MPIHLAEISKMSGYPGNKAQAGVFQTIIGQIPPTDVYIESFFGSGQIFWRMRRAASSIIIDQRPDLLVKAGDEAGVIAIPGDALKVLAELKSALPADAVMYCDPPYPLSTRGRQGRFYYDHEMTDQDHASLLALLQEMPCRILLSSYPNKLYTSQLQAPRWRCIEYRTRTRGSTVTEVLWCNFPEPEVLHDMRYAGKNFRQRLSLKRLANRWLKKLEGMDGRKRSYVLDAISQRHYQRGLPATSARNGAADRALLASGKVRVKVVEQKEGREPIFIGRCYLGTLPVFETKPRVASLQAMMDAQDWVLSHGKTPHFENA